MLHSFSATLGRGLAGYGYLCLMFVSMYVLLYMSVETNSVDSEEL